MKYFFFSTLLCLTVLLETSAQRKKQNTLPNELPSIQTKTAGMKKYPGYFAFYYDQKQDKIYLIVDRWDTEFLYLNFLSTGVGSNDLGLDRGQLGKEHIVRFDRHGHKVFLTEPNYRYRAISDNAMERKAVEEAFAQSVLWGFMVVAEEGNSVLIDATDFFLRDAHGVTEVLKQKKQGFYAQDNTRSTLYLPGIKNFPYNAAFEATLTFVGIPTGEAISSVTPSPAQVTVRQRHSFVQLPDEEYKPRTFDPRAGYSGMVYYDYATPIGEPIEKRFIRRHRLTKKNPEASMSEAVKPIVYYVDPGIPEPIRSALMDGARWWNEAFEKAGYKNAFQVALLPEGADPLDIRYHVIQWVHRSTRGWSYGATVSDPRTGEIIKGHVSLGSLRVRQDFLIAEGLLAPYKEGKQGHPEMENMALARLRQLAAHEVGHTLGLAHSYTSSTEDRASVMDYPHPLLGLKEGKVDLSDAYAVGVGALDLYSIAYGYTAFPSDRDEEKALRAIVQNSLKAGLTFLSDQDARPAGSAHPNAHLWDNGKDVVDELLHLLEVRSVAIQNFGEQNIKMHTPIALLEETLTPIYFLHRYQMEAVSKIIGGLNYHYAVRGDNQLVTEMIAPEQQQKALNALLRTVHPDVLMLPERLIQLIPPRPLGYFRNREVMKIRTELTFDIQSIAEAAANMTFRLLLHPARAARLVEYHARNEHLPSLQTVLQKTVEHTFEKAPESGYKGLIRITVNNVLLFHLFSLAAHTDIPTHVKAIVMMELDELKSWLLAHGQTVSDKDWKAHYAFAVDQIERFKENPQAFEQDIASTPPPGQPIGSTGLEYCDF